MKVLRHKLSAPTVIGKHWLLWIRLVQVQIRSHCEDMSGCSTGLCRVDNYMSSIGYCILNMSMCRSRQKGVDTV